MSDSPPQTRWVGRTKLSRLVRPPNKTEAREIARDILKGMPKRQAQADAFLKGMGMMPYAPGDTNPWAFTWNDWVRDFGIVAKVIHIHQPPDAPMRYVSTEKLEAELQAALEAYIEDPTAAPSVFYAVQKMIDKNRALKVALYSWPVHEQSGPDQITAAQKRNADGLLAQRNEALSKLERQVLPQTMQEVEKAIMNLLRNIDWELKGSTYVARFSGLDSKPLAAQLAKLGHGRVVKPAKQGIPEIHCTDDDMKALKLGPYRERDEPSAAR